MRNRDVFIHYRAGVNGTLARTIFHALRAHGIDALMRLEGEQMHGAILEQASACSYLVVLLTPGALDRPDDPADALLWQHMAGRAACIALRSPHLEIGELPLSDEMAESLRGAPAVPLDYDALDDTLAALEAQLVPRQLPGAAHTAADELVARLVAGVEVLPAFGPGQVAAQDHFERALLHPASDLSGKIALYSEAIARYPQFVEAYTRRGGAHLAAGRPDACIDDCTQAIRIAPQFAEAYYNRGLAHSRKEAYSNALADYDAAIRLDPTCDRLYVNRGAVRTHLGDLTGAIADYSEAIALNPDLIEAYLNRSTAYANTDNFESALNDYARVLGLNTRRGVTLRPAEGNIEGTISYLERLLRRWPDHPQAEIVRHEIERLRALLP